MTENINLNHFLSQQHTGWSYEYDARTKTIIFIDSKVSTENPYRFPIKRIPLAYRTNKAKLLGYAAGYVQKHNDKRLSKMQKLNLREKHRNKISSKVNDSYVTRLEEIAQNSQMENLELREEFYSISEQQQNMIKKLSHQQSTLINQIETLKKQLNKIKVENKQLSSTYNSRINQKQHSQNRPHVIQIS